MVPHYRLTVIFVWFCCTIYAQDIENPVDFRQHNLAKYNTSLVNPVFSFINNDNPKVATWVRVQWAELNNSPTTFFTNYSGRIGDSNGIGLGVFQNDTGIFTNIGVIGNYAHGFKIGEESWLTFGVNVIGTTRTIDRNNFTAEEFAMFPRAGRDDFLLTLMPGINLTIGNFNIGASSENLLDYNFSDSELEANFDDKIFLGHTSYNFHLTSSEDVLLKTTAYIKSVPGTETQLGGNILLDIRNVWMQAGYNSFFGPSVGLGAKLFNTFGLGGLIELGNANDSFNSGPTYEFLLALEFGKNKKNPYSFEGPVKKKKKKTQKIAEIKKAELTIQKDSIVSIPLEEFFKPEDQDDHFSIIEDLEGVDYGFYLVVNVYGTQKYFNLFLEKLKKEGLSPKYFFNKENNYYYVYLKKYDTLEEIRKARTSNYNGNYLDETWILWIKEKE
ncbi:type IX secretion system membrane protein PorP/SprF [Flavobacteriaceae bacterium R38]|nr:type IX secretion system membrane protein PorP/SprF [Flavobacteriaceae bacterium R38]